MQSTEFPAPKGRFGGRSYDELRPLRLQTGLLSKSNGSCRFSMHATQVLASVRGPMQPVSSKKELIDRANVEVFVKAVQVAQSGVTSTRATQSNERELEAAIKGVLDQVFLLEQFPRTTISVNIQVISADGSLLTCATMAAACAAVDAGIPMKAIPSCSSCVIQRQGGSTEYLVDPDAAEEKAADAVVHLCLDGFMKGGEDGESSAAKYLAIYMKGTLNEEEMKEAMRRVEGGAAAVKAFVEMSLQKAIHSRMEMQSAT